MSRLHTQDPDVRGEIRLGEIRQRMSEFQEDLVPAIMRRMGLEVDSLCYDGDPHWMYAECVAWYSDLMVWVVEQVSHGSPAKRELLDRFAQEAQESAAIRVK